MRRGLYICLAACVAVFPVAAMGLQILSLYQPLGKPLMWMAFELPRYLARFFYTEYAIAGFIVSIWSSFTFTRPLAKAFGSFMFIACIGVAQAFSYLMPVRMLSPDICQKCHLLLPAAEPQQTGTVIAVTMVTMVLWLALLSIPIAAIVSGFHYYAIKLHEALWDPVAET